MESAWGSDKARLRSGVEVSPAESGGLQDLGLEFSLLKIKNERVVCVKVPVKPIIGRN